MPRTVPLNPVFYEYFAMTCFSSSIIYLMKIDFESKKI
jgi:hypothetical protein